MARTRKPPKLTLAKAIKYYAAGYKEDCLNTLSYFKSHEDDAEALIKEMTAIVYAPSLEAACRLAVEFDYGCGPNDDPNDWRSHVESISDIRRAAGHYEPDFSDASIVKDLVTLAVLYNDCLNEDVPDREKQDIRTTLNYQNGLADRIETVYGRLWEESK